MPQEGTAHSIFHEVSTVAAGVEFTMAGAAKAGYRVVRHPQGGIEGRVRVGAAGVPLDVTDGAICVICRQACIASVVLVVLSRTYILPPGGFVAIALEADDEAVTVSHTLSIMKSCFIIGIVGGIFGAVIAVVMGAADCSNTGPSYNVSENIVGAVVNSLAAEQLGAGSVAAPGACTGELVKRGTDIRGKYRSAVTMVFDVRSFARRCSK